MKLLLIMCIILQWSILCFSQLNICLNRRKVCPSNQLCVTWDRACSVGANCIESSIRQQPFFECISVPVWKYVIPSVQLCGRNEIWVRGVRKLCLNPPCPLWWGYSCYTRTASTETCANRNLRCPPGKVCIVEESCNHSYCEPKPICSNKF